MREWLEVTLCLFWDYRLLPIMLTIHSPRRLQAGRGVLGISLLLSAMISKMPFMMGFKAGVQSKTKDLSVSLLPLKSHCHALWQVSPSSSSAPSPTIKYKLRFHTLYFAALLVALHPRARSNWCDSSSGYVLCLAQGCAELKIKHCVLFFWPHLLAVCEVFQGFRII